MKIPVSRTFILSAAAVAAATLLCAVALARAIGVEPVDATDAPPLGVASLPEIQAAEASVAGVPSEGVLGMESLALAVDHDPFMPDRRRASPYRLPGELVEQPVITRREEPDPPPFRVIGTAQVGDAGIALIEVENTDYPEVVKVGESLLGYRLQRVETEAATVVGQGQTVRLAVERGEATPAREERSGRNSRGRNTNAQLEAAAERMQQIVQQLTERGLPSQMIEQIVRQGGRALQFQVQDGRSDRVIIRARPDTSTVQLPEPR